MKNFFKDWIDSIFGIWALVVWIAALCLAVITSPLWVFPYAIWRFKKDGEQK